MLLRLSLQKRMMSSLSSSLGGGGGGGGNEIMRRRRDYKVPDISMEERISISDNVFKRYTMEEGDDKEKRRRDGREGVGIVWFRNDLRILDNEVLNKAWMRSSSLIPVYCMDPRIFSGTTRHFGFPKTGDIRAKFLVECLTDLKMNLKKRGLDLLVRHGKPEVVLPSIAKAFVAGTTASSSVSTVVVYAQKETCSEEIHVERLVLQELTSMQQHLQQQQSSCSSGNPTIKFKLELMWGGLTMYHVDDLPFSPSDLPDVYTQFRKSVESKCRVRACCKLPRSLGPPASVSMEEVGGWGTIDLPSPQQQQQQQPPFQGLNFIGGETAALARLHEYFWKKDLIKVYKETRNGMLGSDYSTKFSPWLASGCLSPRYIYEEVKRYEKERLANDSTYWVLFELMWRDYFRFISIKYGTSIFHLGGPRKVVSKWNQDWLLFQSWRDGQTGYPLIDANMKELSTTGFMSNRGRQIVCSFLVRDMGIDWRMGAEWFETSLLDYDPCSNYGNWTYGAGVGNDPRENRYFSIPKQAKNYDPEGEYVSFWLPQLKCLPREKRNFPGPYSYIKQVIPLKFDNTNSVKSNDFSSKASSSNNSRKYRRGKNVHPN